MMKKLKQPLSLSLCLLMIVSLFAGVVMPPVGETVIQAEQDAVVVEEPIVPYAKVLDIATTQTVTLSLPVLDDDGNVTVDENGATVYSDVTKEGVYVANDTEWLFILDTSLTDASVEKICDANGYFFYTYGDGTTWGTGATYKVQWGVTAFGSAGSYPITNMIKVIKQLTPKVDQDAVILVAPGYTNSTSSAGSIDDSTFNLPEGKTADDVTEDELLNVYFYGPQSGKSPLEGSACDIQRNSDGSVAAANGRTVENTTEFVFTSTLWFPKNAVYHMDGFAANKNFSIYAYERACTIVEDGRNAKALADLTEEEAAAAEEETYLSGMYIENLFCKWENDQSYTLFRLGGNTDTANCCVIFEMNNSVFDHSQSTHTGSSNGSLQGNRISINNCAFVDFNAEAENYSSPWRVRVSPTEYERTASLPFYGTSEYSFNYTNNYHPNFEAAYGFLMRANYYDAYDEDGVTINFDGNRWENFGTHYTDTFRFFFLDWSTVKQLEDGSEIYVSDGASGGYIDYEVMNLDFLFQNNYISVNPEVTEKKHGYILDFYNLPIGSTAPIIKGNTFKSDVTEYPMADICGCGPLTDLSGNLFLDKNGNVREAHTDDVSGYLAASGTNTVGDNGDSTNGASSNNAKVLSDIYASDEMAGGIKELMNVSESPEGLTVVHSDIQLTGDDTDEYEWIRGTMTVLPHYERTYKTANLFDWINENVKLEGVYRDVHCCYPLETIDKAYFMTTDETVSDDENAAYAKVVYSAGSTTCTVVFRMVMPTRYIFIIGDDGKYYNEEGTAVSKSYPVTKTGGEWDADTDTHTFVYEGSFEHTFNGDTYTLDMSNSDNFDLTYSESESRDTLYYAKNTVNGVEHVWVAKGLSYGTASNAIRRLPVSNASSTNWIMEPLKDVVVFTEGVHSTGSNRQAEWTYDIYKSSALVGSGFELDEPAVIQQTTTLDQDVYIDFDITLAVGTYSAGQKVPQGTKLVKGDPNPKYASAALVSHINKGEYWLDARENDVYFTVTGVSLGGKICTAETVLDENKEPVQATDEDGNPSVDENGDPIYETEDNYRSFEVNILNSTDNNKGSFEYVNFKNLMVMVPNLMTQKNDKFNTSVSDNMSAYVRQNHICIEDMYYNWRETADTGELVSSNNSIQHIVAKTVTFRINDSAMYGLGNPNADSDYLAQNRLTYLHTPNPNLMASRPYESVIRVTNTDFVGGCAHGISAGWYVNKGVGDWYDGLELTITDCRAIDFEYYLVNVMPGVADACKLTFNDNYIYNSAADASYVINGYHNVAGMCYDQFKSVEVKGNIFINRTKPFHFNFNGGSNSINVDENVFLLTGDFQGNNPYAKKMVGGSGYEKSDWYYMTEDFSIKSTDLYPVFDSLGQCNVTANAVSGSAWTAELFSKYGQTFEVTDFTNNAADGQTVKVFTDSTFATEAAEDATISGTAYVQITYTSSTGAFYIANWIIDIGIPDAWEEAGLAPVGDETYVDLTTQELYAKRDGGNDDGLIVAAQDWVGYTGAYLSYDEETDTLSDQITLSANTDKLEAESEVNTYTTKDSDGNTVTNIEFRELAVGTVFYARMNTTGVVYKLTYGVTAMNMNHANTCAAATILLFPGEAKSAWFNTGTAYSGNSTALYVSDYKTGLFGVGGTIDGQPSYGCINYRILGAQAGVPAGDATKGSLVRNDTGNILTESTESRIAAASSFYIMKSALNDGATIEIDGVALVHGAHVSTDAGENADAVKTTNNNVICTLKNCVGYSMSATGNGVFRFRAKDGTISTDYTKNLASNNMTLNIEDCYFERESENTGYWGKVNLNSINIKRSVMISDGDGFYINPTRGDLNPNEFALNYTCKDSYISNKNGYLFGVYYNSTTGLEKRSEINVDINGNRFVDMCLKNSDWSRACIFVNFAIPSAEVAGKMNIDFSDNQVLNTTGAYHTSTNRTSEPLLAIGTSDTMKANSLTVENNTIYGYRKFIYSSETYDYKNNLYYDKDGNLIALSFYSENASASDVMLYDYEHKASDFNVIGGAAEPATVTWEAGEKMDTVEGLQGVLRYPYASDLTADALKNSIRYNSSDVESKGLYTDAACTTEATTLVNNTVYYLKAGYTDGNTVPAVYVVTLGDDVGYPESTIQYTGDRIYLVPKSVTEYDEYGKGDWVKYGVDLNGDGTKENYYFVVDKNIVNDITDITPNTLTGEYDVYLFDYENTEYGGTNYVYTADDLSLNDETVADRVYNIYGAQMNVSPVVVDSTTGRPTDELSPSRDKTIYAETIVTGDIVFNYGTKVTMNGITFEGAATRLRQDSAADDGDLLATLNVLYCVTLDSALDESYTSFIHLKGTARHNAKIQENYMKFAHANASAGLIVLRHANSVTISKNYLELAQPQDDNDPRAMIWLATTKDGRDAAYADPTAFTLENNTIQGQFHVDDMAQVYNLTWKIINNEFIPLRRNELHMVHFGSFENTKGNCSLTIQNNVFSAIETDDTFTGNLTAIYFDDFYNKDGKITQKFTGNTFDNSTGVYRYAVDNTHAVSAKEFVADFSNGNVFNEFTYNYGDHAYMEGSFAARNYTDGQRVIFSNGTKHATFTYPEKFTGFVADMQYVANYIDIANWGTLDAPASGHNVADSELKTIEDVVVTADNYHFNPGYGMFLRIEAPDGSLYFNSLPIKDNAATTETVINQDADGEDISFDVAKFKVSVCAADGTPVADYTDDTTDDYWYDTTIYRNPIRLFMNTGEVMDVPTNDSRYSEEKPYSIRWRGNVVAVGYDTVSSLIDRTGMAIVDYGMVYGNTTDVLADETEIAATIGALAHKGTVTNTEGKKYTKYSYCESWNIQNAFNPGDSLTNATQPTTSYENGRLYTHKLYNFRFYGLAPAKTRYGRMYLTFRVGSGETYTVLSEIQEVNDQHTVTTPDAQS